MDSDSGSEEDAEYMTRLASVLVTGTEGVSIKNTSKKISKVENGHQQISDAAPSGGIVLPESFSAELKDLVRHIRVPGAATPKSAANKKKKTSAREKPFKPIADTEDPDFKRHCLRQLESALDKQLIFHQSSDAPNDATCVAEVKVEEEGSGFTLLSWTAMQHASSSSFPTLGDENTRVNGHVKMMSSKEFRRRLEQVAVEGAAILSQSPNYVISGNSADKDQGIARGIRSKRRWISHLQPKILQTLAPIEPTPIQKPKRQDPIRFLPNTKLRLTDKIRSQLLSLPNLVVPAFRKQPKKKKKRIRISAEQ